MHCPNPGRMLGLDAPGARVWVSRASNPARTLPLTLELVETAGGLVGINTMHPNRLVEEAIIAGRIKELQGYEVIRREAPLRRALPHRPPVAARRPAGLLRRGQERTSEAIAGAEFPDAVTVRGAKHLGALARQVAQGARAVVVYVVQRTDCADFRIAADIDPIYAASFAAALDGGVEALCYACEVNLEDVRLTAPLPILLS